MTNEEKKQVEKDIRAAVSAARSSVRIELESRRSTSSVRRAQGARQASSHRNLYESIIAKYES